MRHIQRAQDHNSSILPASLIITHLNTLHKYSQSIRQLFTNIKERMQISREKQLRLWYLRVFPMHRYAQYKVKYANIALTILLFLAIWWIQPLKYMRGTDTTVPTTSTISTTVSKSLRSEVSPILHHDYQLVNGCYIDIPEEDRVLHIVHPPVGAVSHLVCCNTTSGLFTIAVHRTWAPIGAARFMDMVNKNTILFQ